MNSLTIKTKEQLFTILGRYLDALFGKIDSDSITFWATYMFFVIKEDRICFRNRLGGYCLVIVINKLFIYNIIFKKRFIILAI
uniref:Uncharacterized protein n=1 Tax=viral metagenome TaxID=1070528 RepID=A0A6C0C6L0_9ZZZZ